jgi:hypothetical protein
MWIIFLSGMHYTALLLVRLAFLWFYSTVGKFPPAGESHLIEALKLSLSVIAVDTRAHG